jgi:hypothetical protein
MRILHTMSVQKGQKLNQLLATLDDSTVVSSRWLRARGYSTSLVARYVASGWLESPARGAYVRKGAALYWGGVVQSLQTLEALPLHVGGRYALAAQGHEHFLRMAKAATITLYGAARLPAWLNRLGLDERFAACGAGPFAPVDVPFAADTDDGRLFEYGLQSLDTSSNGDPVVFATAERAMLELCDLPPDANHVYEADAIMQGMGSLRPELLGRMLRNCNSIKAKRLFLALAERHAHSWLKHLDLTQVELGRGKRSLVAGGRLHPKYHVTLPADLDEQLG